MKHCGKAVTESQSVPLGLFRPFSKPQLFTALAFDMNAGEADDIGTPDRCVHDLRHTYAVLSLQNGDDIKTVQGNLGHATAAFTLDVYGHVSERMKEDSAARMQAYMDGLA